MKRGLDRENTICKWKVALCAWFVRVLRERSQIRFITVNSRARVLNKSKDIQILVGLKAMYKGSIWVSVARDGKCGSRLG